MMYTEEDLLELDTGEDAHIPDKPEDAKGIYGTTKRNGDDDDEGEASEWTVRKCAAVCASRTL